MDKNSITGLALITLILIGFWFLNKPSQQEVEALQARQDSIRKVETLMEQERIAAQLSATESQNVALPEAAGTLDSAQSALLEQASGLMSPFVKGETTFTTLENEKIKIIFSNKGGKIYSVQLKDYKTHDGKPLILFDGDKNKFGFTFTHNTRIFNTNDLYFNLKSQTDTSVVYEIASASGEALTFNYVLPRDEYMAKFAVQTRQLQNLMATPRGTLDFNWYMEMLSFEKGRNFEQQYSGLYYKYYKDEVDWLSTTKDDNEDLRTRVKWIGYKSQFFSTVFIADDAFSSAVVKSQIEKDENSPFLQYNSSEAVVPVDFTRNETINFKFYFGPNHFYTLNSYGKDLALNQLINLGWGIFGWINRLVVIPVFNYLQHSISSYGIIILLLTILIKVVLFPFTYKSYMSSAKMKVLKPQIEEINQRIPKEKAMERQQATMNLYKKAGVNPMGGCLPMLLQMPILIAMFRFFPASIELRQESFLWATDLSTYDSIMELPFSIPFYGSHVSLFTLLMTLINLAYTKINSDMTQSTSQMPGMKGMMYMMPVMFLFFFNNYASGLSYYYFISTLITVGQTLLIRKFVDEKKILQRLHANQKKPVKKSKFAQRLEEMSKQQQIQKRRK